MTYAWVLIFAMNTNWSVTIPGIASKQECERLEKQIEDDGGAGRLMFRPIHCLRYQLAK